MSKNIFNHFAIYKCIYHRVKCSSKRLCKSILFLIAVCFIYLCACLYIYLSTYIYSLIIHAYVSLQLLVTFLVSWQCAYMSELININNLMQCLKAWYPSKQFTNLMFFRYTQNSRFSLSPNNMACGWRAQCLKLKEEE